MANPFEILGLPARFDLDPKQLHARFIQASSANHPDRFTDPLEQADAAERSATINDAYSVLKDPESRANALLTLLGGPAKEADKSLPPQLLMEVMQVREELEQAIHDHDADTLKRLRTWAQDRRLARLDAIAQLFARAAQTPEARRADLLKQARLELNGLRYFERMIEQTPASCDMPGAMWNPSDRPSKQTGPRGRA